jgi:hypothetical protein
VGAEGVGVEVGGTVVAVGVGACVFVGTCVAVAVGAGGLVGVGLGESPLSSSPQPPNVRINEMAATYERSRFEGIAEIMLFLP